MAHLWKVGDLAVCIAPQAKFLRFKAVYRVEAITPEQKWNDGAVCVGLVLVGIRHPINRRTGHFCGYHFRPILPAEPAFTEAMRSLKPRVEA